MAESSNVTTRDLIQAKVIIDNNIAYITVHKNDKSRNIKEINWNIKIVYNSKTLIETGFGNTYNLSYPLKEDGMYLLFYQVKINGELRYHARDSFWYYSKAAKDKFDSYYTSYTEFDDKQPELSELKYPYQNLAMIMSSTDSTTNIESIKIDNICSSAKVYFLAKSEKYVCYALATNPPLKKEKQSLFFSGKTKTKDRLIIGQDDIKETDDIISLLDEIGYWSAIYKDNGQIKIENDYFGMYSLYVFNENNLKIVSNSFHMLVLILKELDKKLELDIETIIPYFSMGQRMLFAQLASEKTFIKGIKKLSIDKGIRVIDGKLEEFNKPIFEVLNSREVYSLSGYQTLKKKAEEEIIDNIEIVLKDKRFEKVICDVTGGKDSRTVLAALMNCNQNLASKILINSKGTQETSDYSVFIPLNHLHSYPYNNMPEKLKKISLIEKDLRNRSITMGVSFSRPLPWNYEYEDFPKNRVRLIGAGGEALMRPAYSMFYPYADYSSRGALIKDVLLGCNNGILNFNEEIINKSMRKVIDLGLLEVQGTSFYEILNNYYLYFRNAYHFGLQNMIDSMDGAEESWSPLFSKSAMKAWHMVCSKFRGIQFQIELINDMKQELLTVPFESVQDNKEVKKIIEKGIIKSISDRDVNLDYDNREWEEARKTIIKNRIVSNSKEESQILDRSNELVQKSYYDILLKRLNKILHYDRNFRESIGLDLFTFITKKQEAQTRGLRTGDLIYLYNKITSLSDIIGIIQNQNNERHDITRPDGDALSANKILHAKNLVVYAMCSENYLKEMLPGIKKIREVSYIVPNEIDGCETVKNMKTIKIDELLNMKDVAVVIAQAGEEHIKNSARMFRRAGIPYDHISNYGDAVSLTILKALEYKEYYDYLGNYIKYESVKGSVLIKKDNIKSINNRIIFKNISTTKGLTVTLFGEDSQVSFGNSTCYQGIFLISTKGKIDIGDDCMLSHDVFISQTDQHLIFDLQTQKRVNINKNIYIGNHVWIGRSVRILGGCQISDNCIVGAYTVTSGKFSEKNCIIAGNPGRVIRRGIIWARDSQSLNYMTFEECKDRNALKYLD